MDPILEPEHRELEEALLRAGRDVGMSADLQAKTLAALGVATAGVALTTTAKASAWSSLTGKAGVVWGSVVGLVGVGGAVLAVGLSQGPDADQSRAGTTSSPIVEDRDVVQVPANAQDAVGKTQAPVTTDVPTVEALTGVDATALPGSEGAALEGTEGGEQEPDATVRRDVRGSGDSRTSVLREELSHISKVEAALRAGAQGEALSLLAAYRTRFARPKLGLEAEVLTIQALYESGSVAAAQQRARSFLQRHPKSPLGARAKRYLRE